MKNSKTEVRFYFLFHPSITPSLIHFPCTHLFLRIAPDPIRSAPRFPPPEYDDNELAAHENVEWEDNWDDEVEGEDDFSRRLRAQLEAQKNAKD